MGFRPCFHICTFALPDHLHRLLIKEWAWLELQMYSVWVSAVLCAVWSMKNYIWGMLAMGLNNDHQFSLFSRELRGMNNSNVKEHL